MRFAKEARISQSLSGDVATVIGTYYASAFSHACAWDLSFKSMA